jgi:hypothetical protein
VAAIWLPVQHQRSQDQSSLAKQTVTTTEFDRPTVASFNSVRHPPTHGPPIRERLCVWRI